MKFSLILVLIFFVTNINAADRFFKTDASFIVVAPPVVNKDYFGLDMGFVVDKKVEKWNLNYHLFVTATLFQDSSKKIGNDLKSAGLGFKFGMFAPFFRNEPFYLKVGTGYAKTALHKSPIFGKDEDAVKKKNMFMFEPGLAYKVNRLIFGVSYQLSTVSYFKRKIYFQIGVSY